MTQNNQMMLLGVLNLSEAKQLQKEAKLEGIEIFLEHNDSTCRRGCQVTVELHAFAQDIDRVSLLMQRRQLKLLDGHDVNFDQLNSVYDPAQKEAKCPACGFTFSTELNECPDCGLCF